MAVTVWYL